MCPNKDSDLLAGDMYALDVDFLTSENKSAACSCRANVARLVISKIKWQKINSTHAAKEGERERERDRASESYCFETLTLIRAFCKGCLITCCAL